MADRNESTFFLGLGDKNEIISETSMSFFLFFFLNIECLTNLHSSLHRGHANLLCTVLILVYMLPKPAHGGIFISTQYLAEDELSINTFLMDTNG